MAKTLIWAVALIVSALILASGGLNAQRDVVPIDEPDPPSTPAPVPDETSAVPVSVENFPTVDIRGFPHVVTVEGTVDVGNLPAVQEVIGAVDVGNLPLDADGNVLVAGTLEVQTARFQFVGFSDPTLWYSFKLVLEASRECSSKYPQTRTCDMHEIALLIPVPPDPPIEYALVIGGVATDPVLRRWTSDGFASFVSGAEYVVACCGY